MSTNTQSGEQNSGGTPTGDVSTGDSESSTGDDESVEGVVGIGGNGTGYNDPTGREQRFAQFFRPIYYLLFEQQGNITNSVENTLREVGSDESVENFLSRSVGYGTIIGTIMWAISTFVFAYIFTGIIDVGAIIGFPVPNETLLMFIELLRLPVLIGFTGITVGGLFFIGGVTLPYIMLQFEVSSRERKINILLPEVIDYMYALSVGGMNQVEIMREVARAGDTYGEVSKEFRIILNNMDTFGTDYHTAIRERALNTPSEELTEFLINMLSIVSSGGDLGMYLQEQREQFTESAEQAQERELNNIELFGEMYLTLSLFPLLVIIIIVLMEMTTSLPTIFLPITTYVIIPMVGVLFSVLISTVTRDEVGSGILTHEDGSKADAEPGPLDIGPAEDFGGDLALFDKIRNKEVINLYRNILSNPTDFLSQYPSATLLLTIPFYLTAIGIIFTEGLIPVTIEEFKSSYVIGTLVYVFIPIYIVGFPFSLFYEYGKYKRGGITNNLTSNLRELASINDSGQTLLQALHIVGTKRNPAKINKEFEEVYNKVQYGQSMKRALVDFNNKYGVPRLARTVKLISKAQETSSEITDVLRTASESSKRADRIQEERKNRTLTQVGIVGMTFLIMLGVLVVLQNLFVVEIITVAQDLESQGVGTNQFSFSFTINEINMYFFHAIIGQGISSGLMMGYVRTGSIKACIKYMVILPTIALVVWSIFVL